MAFNLSQENILCHKSIIIDELTKKNCDIQKLFITKSVLNEVLKMQPVIADKLKQLKPILKEEWEPRINVGEQCVVPHECDFKSYCSHDYLDMIY